MSSNVIVVSVIIPVLNEEKYIAACLNSILEQDFNKENMEILIADGGSTDNTRAIVDKFISDYPELIRILENKGRIQSCAMNVGIANARGKYIMRLDAHADYAEDYISKCVHYLDTTDADNVGGVAETKAHTVTGKAISKMLSSPFGVGNSQFRTGGESGYVDTVPFGCFRKEVFEKLGGFNEDLARNEDNEINHRIISNGGKVYLASDIHFTYYCRETVKDICKMAYENGKWTIIASRLIPGAMRLRHFIPFIFVLSLFVLSIGSFLTKYAFYLLLMDLGAYFLCDLFFSCKIASCFSEALRLIILHLVFHISYGVGSFKGIFFKEITLI